MVSQHFANEAMRHMHSLVFQSVRVYCLYKSNGDPAYASRQRLDWVEACDPTGPGLKVYDPVTKRPDLI